MGSNHFVGGFQKKNRSAIKPRCAYFFGFKRFSKNRQKVHKMAKTEATVTSGVKNWYIIFCFRNCWTWEMPIGAKTMDFFAKSEFFDYKVFPKSVFRKFAPPPGTPLGGQQGGFAPNYDGKGKVEGESELSHADRSADYYSNSHHYYFSQSYKKYYLQQQHKHRKLHPDLQLQHE